MEVSFSVPVALVIYHTMEQLLEVHGNACSSRMHAEVHAEVHATSAILPES
jgi:hypothetical protein